MAWYARIENALHMDRKKPEVAEAAAKSVGALAGEIKAWYIKNFPGQEVPKITPMTDSVYVRVDCSDAVGRQLWRVKGLERVIQSDLPMYGAAAAPGPK